MSRLAVSYQLLTEVKQNLPSLSVAQAAGLALWIIGIESTGVANLSTIVEFNRSYFGKPSNTVLQRMREWYKEAECKSGRRRVTLSVETCFGSLLAWIARIWQGDVIAIAVDASTIGDRFTFLNISVVFRGMAIPVAWRVLKGNQPGNWEPYWCEMLEKLRAAVRSDQCVVVLADRGLYSRWLFRKIVSLGWHPYLRIKLAGFFQPEGGPISALTSFVGSPGQSCKLRGTAFKRENRISCTLLTWRQEGMEPLLVLTDLNPDQCDPLWYRERFWIEREFKTQKSAAMQLQRTRIADAGRLSRLLLAISVSMLRAVCEGAEREDRGETEPSYNYAKNQRTRASGTRYRRISLYEIGRLALMKIFMCGNRLRRMRLRPEPMPSLAAYAGTG